MFFLKLIRRILFLVLLAGAALGGYAYLVLSRYENLPTYREQIEYLIKHRVVFLPLYKAKIIFLTHYEKISTTKTKKTMVESLFDWSEARVMRHLENKDIKCIQDLPWLERSVIKTLDGTSYLNKLAQSALAPLTRLFSKTK